MRGKPGKRRNKAGRGNNSIGCDKVISDGKPI